MSEDNVRGDSKICFAKFPKELRKEIGRSVFKCRLIWIDHDNGEKVEWLILDTVIDNINFYLQHEKKLSYDLKNMLFEYAFYNILTSKIIHLVDLPEEGNLNVDEEVVNIIYTFENLEDGWESLSEEKINKIIREKLRELEKMKEKYPKRELKRYLPKPPRLMKPFYWKIIGNQKDTDEYVKYIEQQVEKLEKLSGSAFCDELKDFYISLSNLCYNSSGLPAIPLAFLEELTFWCIIKGVDKNLGDIIIDFICASKVRDYKLFFKEKLKELENCKL